MTLDARDRLLEPTYLTLFENHVVGVVRNAHTPGPRAAAAAIAKVTGVDAQLVPIPREDVLYMISSGKGVSSWDMTIASGSTNATSTSEDPIETADRLGSLVSGSEKVTVRFSADTAANKRRLKRQLIQFLEAGGPDDVEAAHAWVSRDTGSEVIDLLETDISTQVQVPVEGKTRYLLPDAAREAALEAFDQMRLPLTRAIDLGDPNAGPEGGPDELLDDDS